MDPFTSTDPHSPMQYDLVDFSPAPGESVMVQGGRLDGLSGTLVTAEEGGRCTVQVYKDVLLVVPRERLVRARTG